MRASAANPDAARLVRHQHQADVDVGLGARGVLATVGAIVSTAPLNSATTATTIGHRARRSCSGCSPPRSSAGWCSLPWAVSAGVRHRRRRGRCSSTTIPNDPGLLDMVLLVVVLRHRALLSFRTTGPAERRVAGRSRPGCVRCPAGSSGLWWVRRLPPARRAGALLLAVGPAGDPDLAVATSSSTAGSCSTRSSPCP